MRWEMRGREGERERDKSGDTPSQAVSQNSWILLISETEEGQEPCHVQLQLTGPHQSREVGFDL